MGSIGGGELPNFDKMQISAAREERILVLVRLRPLNEKEIVANEVADWECINDTTILYRNTLREGSTFPSAYSFDRVFRGESSTRQVYDDAVKEVALSVVSGINSSIFAYGQTCSGKTYTMMGITEYTVADIFDYIHRHEERAYVLKFSAIEIYNEAIRDLLSTDSTPLRLLDDPEKGTIVEKATEETLKDWNHLQELLSVCEAQRRIGETSLNEKSSRSHQILRLTIESSAREFLGRENSTTLAATVNFVDLAGSERASQSLSSGTRLKEGCHINRSLLTLGTVIRKLSKGRHGHINYRDSKLTRLLQPALGGNARTAIICTLSPARSHVEQTRNTLLFACCAKEVTTKAQVNVVMSDKALVKQLQKELARLESELSRPAPASTTSDYTAIIRKKDLQIQKMEKEIRELTKQRDLAESRIEDLLKIIGNDQTSRNGMDSPHHSQQWESESSASESSGVAFSPFKGKGIRRLNMNNIYGDSGSNMGEPYYLEDDMEGGRSLSNTSSPISMGKKITVSAEDTEDYCKEVRCIEMDEARRKNYIEPNPISNPENGEILALPMDNTQNGFTYDILEERLNHAQLTIDALVTPDPNGASPRSSVNLSKSSSSRENIMAGSSFGKDEEFESTPPENFEKIFAGRPRSMRRKFPTLDYGVDSGRLPRSDSQSSLGSAYTDDLGSPSIKNPAEDDIPSVQTFVEGLKEMAMQATDSTASFGKNAKDVGLDPMCEPLETSDDWPLVFERQRKEIIELWQACNVSVVHRTYFYLLFKGDSSDSIYMAVELRRLNFLKETLSRGGRSGGSGRTITFASSVKALHKERGMLTKLMQKRLSEEERNTIYGKWGIGLRSKRRRVQLANRLWSSTEDMNHITESAAIVAKLVKFVEQGEGLKEMFGLSFTPPSTSRRRSLGWTHVTSSLL